MPIEKTWAKAALALALVASAGCGAVAKTAPPPAEPASAAEPPTEPSTPEEAMASLDRAERELGLALETSASAGGPAPGYAQPPAAQAAPAPEPAGAPKEAREGERAADMESAPSDRGCGTACRAFASLARAADAVCRLTSDGDDRCASARSRVETAKARIAVCGCAG